MLEFITMSVLCTDCAPAGGGLDDTSSKIHLIPVSNKAMAVGFKGKANTSDGVNPPRHLGYVHVSSTSDDFDLGTIVDVKCCVSTGATSGPIMLVLGMATNKSVNTAESEFAESCGYCSGTAL